MTTYERVNFVRKAKGVTWEYLNKKIDGSYHGRMTDFKNGKTSLSNSQLQVIADILDTTLDYFIGKTDDPTPPKKKKPTTQTDSELSEKDIRLIKWFRSLPEERLKAILADQDGPVDAV